MLIQRPRRNRKSEILRSLIQESYLSPSQLISPLFVKEGKNRESISSMPGVFRFHLDSLLKEIEESLAQGVRSFALFPVIDPSLKNETGSHCLEVQGILFKAIAAIKKEFPDVCLISDVALDPYTSHGHDGLIDDSGRVLNDETVARLTQMALLHAQAGFDVVAPSDMMDGRIGAIRMALEEGGFFDVNILAYSAKYASSFYGPFRDALSSTPQFGDKKSYQLNSANLREALRECMLDEDEGADILMVKPALAYLDVIAKLREHTHLPIAAYQVSGEYSMIVAAEQNGWIDGNKVFLETLVSMRRAGADMILSYAAKRVAHLLNNAARG
jgi:porphobilinogen synthase